jgi:hypothetical protein
MSTTTHGGNSKTEFSGATSATGNLGDVFSQIIAALHHSRQLQAARELDRHRHLIDEVRAYEARNRKH